MSKEKVLVLVSSGVAQLVSANPERVEVDIFDYDDWEASEVDDKRELRDWYMERPEWFNILPKWLQDELKEFQTDEEAEVARLKDEKNGVYPDKWDIAN